jgi:hypothetical protein
LEFTVQQRTKLWEQGSVRTSRRGNFWLPGEKVSVNGQYFQHGPMYVAWEAPEHPAGRYPLVLVHGGATQGTEWLDTPDGRPGWAQRFVEAGYPVFVVDRPTQGRSPYHPDVNGPMGPAFSYEEGQAVFFPPDWSDRHTQWPVDADDPGALGAFIAQFGPLPRDLAESQRMDSDRLADLLDRIGPAVVVTHSASGPDGWLVADRRREQVIAIVAVEPMGPPFADIPHIGSLQWGLTAAPITFEPPLADPAQAQHADPGALRIPALIDKPIAVVTGGASPFGAYGPDIVNALVAGGARAERVHLPDYAIDGNGHGLIYERNSDDAIRVVLDWLATHTSPTPE